MKIKLSLGFSVEVSESGKFCLPDRKFTTTELRKVVREVNQQLRKIDAENALGEVLEDD